MTKVMNVHQRLAAAMAEVDYIQKERKQGMNYTIVSHDAVTAKVRPVLLSHGIVYYPVRCEHTHNGNRAECAMTVRFVNIDEPTDYFDVPTFGYGIDAQDKGPGKAMSYAVKYALLKALGLETGDDPDNDSVNYQHETNAPVKNATKQTDKQSASKDGESRRLYTELETDMRKCRTPDDLRRWWKDEECVGLRNKLPESWVRNLHESFVSLGNKLKENQSGDGFPGSTNIRDQEGRSLNNIEAA